MQRIVTGLISGSGPGGVAAEGPVSVTRGPDGTFFAQFGLSSPQRARRLRSRTTVGASAPWSSSPPSDPRITSVSCALLAGFKVRASFMSAGCCWRRSLAVDGGSGTSRGHAREVRSQVLGGVAPSHDRPFFRPDISQVGKNRASVLGCCRSLTPAVGCCGCSHRCCQARPGTRMCGRDAGVCVVQEAHSGPGAA